MKPNYLSTVAILALLAGGCANLPSVGPNYHAPETKAPTHWAEPLAGGETNSTAATVAWWKNFHDAELDSLITRAVSSNLDLRIAQSRVREARAQYGGASADLWPTVNAAGSFARQRQSQDQPVLGSFPALPSSAFENNVYQAGFDASWEIDVFGGKRRAVEAAKAALRSPYPNRWKCNQTAPDALERRPHRDVQLHGMEWVSRYLPPLLQSSAGRSRHNGNRIGVANPPETATHRKVASSLTDLRQLIDFLTSG